MTHFASNLRQFNFCALVDLTSIAINVVLKKLGYAEINAKQAEAYLGWSICLPLFPHGASSQPSIVRFYGLV